MKLAAIEAIAAGFAEAGVRYIVVGGLAARPKDLEDIRQLELLRDGPPHG